MKISKQKRNGEEDNEKFVMNIRLRFQNVISFQQELHK